MKDSRNSSKRESQVIRIDEGELKEHVSAIVRESVEDTLNGLLEAEADNLCHAQTRYERNSRRQAPGPDTAHGIFRRQPEKST